MWNQGIGGVPRGDRSVLEKKRIVVPPPNPHTIMFKGKGHSSETGLTP